MDPHDFSGYLRKHPLFQDIKKDDLRTIAGQMSPLEVKKGHVFYFQGDQPTYAYIIRSGLIKLSRITLEGRELTLHIVQENDLFGEAAILLGSACDTTAEAITPCTLCQIYRNHFLQISESYPPVTQRIARMVSQRLIRLEEKFQIAISRDIPSRTACTLLELAERFGEKSKEGVTINLSLTHLELASLIGSTRETTCVTLNNFRRNGWIQSWKRNIVLRDVAALRSLCET